MKNEIISPSELDLKLQSINNVISVWSFPRWLSYTVNAYTQCASEWGDPKLLSHALEMTL